MIEAVIFHEDIFYEYFRPFRHPSARFVIWGGLGLETFGEDLMVVQDYDANFVWTVVDGTNGPDQWIVPGLHFVNRVCYLVTEVPHDDMPLEFRTEGRPRPLTSRGLNRRLTTLRRMMQSAQSDPTKSNFNTVK